MHQCVPASMNNSFDFQQNKKKAAEINFTCDFKIKI